MIPRYLPTVDLHGWATLLQPEGRRPDNAEALCNALAPGCAFAHHAAFASLRDGLYAWFLGLRKRAGAGSVLMSSQICPVVPRAAFAAGLEARFVDIARDYPTPGPEQFAAGLSQDTVAVLLAPLYGYMQLDWTSLAMRLEGRELLADFGQGLGFRGLDSLLKNAAAVGFSFGIGKGLDTGGALVMSRDPLPIPPGSRSGSLGLGALWRCAALRAVMAAGLYAGIAATVARLANADPWTFEPRVRMLEVSGASNLWLERTRAFERELLVARKRAGELGSAIGRSGSTIDPGVYFSDAATHLRQIIRLAEPARRDGVVGALRAHGIDCAAAGERPPWTYVNGIGAPDFPNTARFTSAAIRLPFLGRLSDTEFMRLVESLEKVLA